LFQDSVVGDKPDDVANPRLLLHILVKRRDRKTGIGPHQDQGLRLGLPELLEQPLENRHRPLGGVSIAGTQHRRQGKAVLPVKDQQQMLPVRVEIAVAEAELLLAVGGVVGGVQVHSDDLPGGGMGLEVQLQQLMREATQVLGGNPVLKA